MKKKQPVSEVPKAAQQQHLEEFEMELKAGLQVFDALLHDVTDALRPKEKCDDKNEKK